MKYGVIYINCDLRKFTWYNTRVEILGKYFRKTTASYDNAYIMKKDSIIKIQSFSTFKFSRTRFDIFKKIHIYLLKKMKEFLSRFCIEEIVEKWKGI